MQSIEQQLRAGPPGTSHVLTTADVGRPFLDKGSFGPVLASDIGRCCTMFATGFSLGRKVETVKAIQCPICGLFVRVDGDTGALLIATALNHDPVAGEDGCAIPASDNPACRGSEMLGHVYDIPA